MIANSTHLENVARTPISKFGSGKYHAAQFYEDDSYLIRSLVGYVAEGLWAGEGVVVLAAGRHLRELRTALTREDVAFQRREVDGQLVFLDADAIVVAVAGVCSPSRERFDELVGAVVERLANQYPKVRAFGEVVDMLWGADDRQGAIVVEGYWHELLDSYPLSLVCGYDLKKFAHTSCADDFAHICHAHTHVLPAEGYAEAVSPQDQMRLVTSLQRQAMALKCELAERAKVESGMRYSEERLHLAFQTAGMGSWTFDVVSGVVAFSTELGALFGLESGDLNGPLEAFLQLIVPEDRERVASTIGESLENGDVRYETQCRIRRPDGELRWLNTRGHIERDAAGDAILMFGVVIDITVQKESEQELYLAKTAAEAANSSKSAFLANMSHEIRTPLGAILGFSELIQDDQLSQEQLRSFISVIMRNGRELAALVDDILDLSKVEAGHVEIESRLINLSMFLTDISTSLGVKAREKGIKLVFSMDTSVPATIVSDPTRLRQILINVIGNAVKFTGAGLVQVTVEFAVKDDRPVLKFLVRDTGCGIPDEGKPRLFRPFSQADSSTTRRFGGTGLGLALSRKLAQRLDGDVTLVESVVGKGSLFVVTIGCGVPLDSPVAETAKVRAPSQREVQPQRPLEGVRILLAEDVPDNQLLILHVLKSSGAVIDVVDNGAAAVDAALRAPYDIVLMDIQMPVMDGLDATRALRAARFGAPIVALTAHALIEERDRCLNAGCTDHLTKPFSYRDLVLVVSKHTAKQRAVRGPQHQVCKSLISNV